MAADREPIAVEVKLVQAPDGRPAVLLQLEQGYLVMCDPDEVQQLVDALCVNLGGLRMALAMLS